MAGKLRVTKFFCCSLKIGCHIIAICSWIISLYEIHAMALGTQLIGIVEGKLDESHDVILGLVLSVSCVNFLLIIGACTECRVLMLPCLILKCLELLIIYISTAVAFAAMFSANLSIMAVSLFSSTLLISALYTYGLQCVWSFYLELGEKVNRQPLINSHEIDDIRGYGYENTSFP